MPLKKRMNEEEEEVEKPSTVCFLIFRQTTRYNFVFFPVLRFIYTCTTQPIRHTQDSHYIVHRRHTRRHTHTHARIPICTGFFFFFSGMFRISNRVSSIRYNQQCNRREPYASRIHIIVVDIVSLSSGVACISLHPNSDMRKSSQHQLWMLSNNAKANELQI